MRRLACTALLTGFLSACAQPQPLRTVPEVQLDRYLGHWVEIAKYPNWFQKDCASGTSADYALDPDGGVIVTNRCRRADGSWNQAIGKARRVGEPGSPKLKVRFAPAWLGWLPMVWGDYWVIDLDPDYSLVAISEPSRQYLWILARSPQPDPQHYQALLERLKSLGFDLGKLETTIQP